MNEDKIIIHRDPRRLQAGDAACQEGAMWYRMVLHLRREALQRGIERGTFRYRPRFQDIADPQAEIVVQVLCIVPLDTKVVGNNLASL